MRELYLLVSGIFFIAGVLTPGNDSGKKESSSNAKPVPTPEKSEITENPEESEQPTIEE